MVAIEAIELLVQVRRLNGLGDQPSDAGELRFTSRHPIEHVAGVPYVGGVVVAFATEKNEVFWRILPTEHPRDEVTPFKPGAVP